MESATGIIIILMAIMFNYFFFRLGKVFEYPGILKQPSNQILKKFQSNKRSIIVSWYGFMFSAVLFAPVVILIHYVFHTSQYETLLGLATASGLIAAIFQVLGLSRWVFAVPYLAASHASSKSESERKTIEMIFTSQHKYLGEGIGEHLGYFFTALWTILLAVFLLLSQQQHILLAVGGIVAGLSIATGMLEFFGFKWASTVNAIGYILWSIWIVTLGIMLIF